MLDLTLLVVVVVVVISGGTAMFFYTSFQKGLIIFYSLGQEFCLFFRLTRFKWSSGQWWIRRKSQRWLSLRNELISLYDRLGRYIMFTAPITGDSSDNPSLGLLDNFCFSCSLERNTSEIQPRNYLISEVITSCIVNASHQNPKQL